MSQQPDAAKLDDDIAASEFRPHNDSSRVAAAPTPNLLWMIAVVLFGALAYTIYFTTIALRRQGYDFFNYVNIAYTMGTVIAPVTAAALGACGLWVWARSGEARSRGALRLAICGTIVALLLLAVRVYATHIEPRRLIIHELEIASEKITAPVRIVHISDIQSDHVGPWEERVFSEVRQLRPDLVIFTGDLLQPLAPATYESELPKIAELIKSVNAPHGWFSIGGDTDWPILNALFASAGGVRMMDSKTADVQTSGGTLRIAGLALGPSAMWDVARPAIRSLEESARSDRAFTMVMGHRPDYVIAAREYDIDLCLAGHTHGGQIRLPRYGPITIASLVPRSWGRGYRELGRTRLHVSAGTGNEHAAGLPNLRVLCPPEITLIRLVPKK